MSRAAEVAPPTHYQILQLPHVNGPINPVDLRVAYRRALLVHHPDKNIPPSRTTSKAAVQTLSHTYSVDQISAAYKILSDAVAKAEYDSSLGRDTRSFNEGPTTNRHAGLETYDLEELQFDESATTWSHGCTCGEEKGYMVTERDLENESEHGEIYVACRGCSLSIRVLFDIAAAGGYGQDQP
jgi:diphthamide biosynthesis protein 4